MGHMAVGRDLVVENGIKYLLKVSINWIFMKNLYIVVITWSEILSINCL